MKPPIDYVSPERANYRLSYDPDTGVLRWRTSLRPSRIGRVAGSKRPDGYVQVGLDGYVILAHRLAFVCMTGYWPLSGIDHINGDPGDNRWANLREADSDQNHWNMKTFANNTSGFRGVTLHRKTGKFVAEIWHKRQKHHLGLFDSKELASVAYEDARSKFFGEFNRERTKNG